MYTTKQSLRTFRMLVTFLLIIALLQSANGQSVKHNQRLEGSFFALDLLSRLDGIPPGGPTVSPNPSGHASVHPTNYPTTEISPLSAPSFPPALSSRPSNSVSTHLSIRPSSSPTRTPSTAPTDKGSSLPSGSPSDTPSSSPSNWPSERPSTRLSVTPTESVYPSSGPSLAPSERPSVSVFPSSFPSSSSEPSLSVIPSDSPSEIPSELPTESVYPSSGPSLAPSETPSVSVFPSSFPSSSSEPSLSVIPSDSPSEIPSEPPSKSLYPSTSPTSMPTISNEPSSSSHPSEVPSDTPTENPSGFPSYSPAPSDEPSKPPTKVPTETPSHYPTSKPSVEPTPSPSTTPTTAPSVSPTTTPSSVPSGSPTKECHDKVAYRSSLNDLACEDHKGTDCVQWKALGLNTTELERLIENCPETCSIPCGSFTLFSIDVSYQLSNIPGLLDSSSKKSLEDASLDYLPDYVRSHEPGMVFELDNVELTFQTLIEPHRRLRSLQEQLVEVRVQFDGFTIGMTSDEVSTLLISGIDSPGYTAALQRWDEFYAMAIISSASERDYVPKSGLEEEGSTGASTATVVVSTIASFSIFVLAFGAFVYHNRSAKWVPQLKLPSLRNANNDGSSPRHMISGQYLSSSPRNMLAQPGSLLSFDESRASGAAVGASLIRLMASLSLSRSKSSTEVDDSESQDSGSPKNSYPAAVQICSPMSDETEVSMPEEHPLSNSIPPMIVIDHIDDEDDNNASHTHKNQQVPSKRVEASTAFISALADCRGRDHPNSFAGMLYTESGFGGELNISAWSNMEDINRALSPLGIIVDSDSDDDTSVASTPVHSTPKESMVPLRRTVSSSMLDSLEKKKGSTTFSSDPLLLESPASSAQPNPLKDRSDEGRWSIDSGDDDDNNNVAVEFGPMPSPVPMESGTASASLNEWTTLPPANEMSGRASNSPSEAKRNGISLWSRSPIAKAFKESAPRSFQRPSLPKKADFGLKRKLWTSEHLEDEHGGSTSHFQNEGPIRYEFEAPRKGQLGLVIESSTTTGPIVHAVKDYSPLFGLVKKGDKIVEVDGKITTHSTLTEITKLLSVKPGRRGSNTNLRNLRIVVTRSTEMQSPAVSVVRHLRDNSYGSSIASSTAMEDVDTSTEDGAQSDDLLRTSQHSSDHSTEKGEL